MLPSKVCESCHQFFNKNPDFSYKTWASIRFCSPKCYGKHASKVKKGVKLSASHYAAVVKANQKKGAKEGGANHWHWQGGRHVSSMGYIQIYSPKHPNRDVRNCVAEHRLVMEKKIGRLLSKEEIVHHINGVKTDNRIENLELTNRRDHPKIHFKGVPKNFR